MTFALRIIWFAFERFRQKGRKLLEHLQGAGMNSQKKSGMIYLVAAISLIIGFLGWYLTGFKDQTRSDRRPSPTGMSQGSLA